MVKELINIDIKPELLDPEDKEFLEDMIKSAFNEVSEEIDDEYNEVIGSLTQGMPF